MKNIKKYLTLLAGAILCGTASSHAATLVDDFSSYAPDSVIGAPWNSVNTDNGTYRLTRIRTDAEDLFGKGTSNKYLQIYYARPTENPAGIVLYRNVPGGYGTIGQVSLQFYDPGESGDSVNGGGLLVRLSTSGGLPANSNSPFAIYLYQGNIYKTVRTSMDWDRSNPIGNYNLHTANDLVLVFNNTNDSTEYNSGAQVIAGGTYDLWLNGSLIASGVSRQDIAGIGSTLNSIALNSAAAGITGMYINEIAFSDKIVIPESSTVSLLLAAVIAAFASSRYLKRNKR